MFPNITPTYNKKAKNETRYHLGQTSATISKGVLHGLFLAERKTKYLQGYT
jgi:hypothetical protein